VTLSHPFGSEGYGREELRAEIASMLLSGELGIGHDPGQHVAYVSSWIKALQEDPTEIFRAAADAEKIQDYVLALSQQQEIAQKVDTQEAIKMDQIKQNTASLFAESLA
jgi:putative DNA primase/helicase